MKLKERDYLAFLAEANEHGQTAKELIYEIINYYVIVNKKRLNTRFRKNQLKKLHSSA